jgi:hemerythrin-like metal-binding protein
MVFIEWSDQYNVGIEPIDQQHRRLVELINQLQDRVDKGVGRQRCLNTMNALTDYVLEHFADEEKLMSEIGFEELDRHQRAHQVFSAKVADIALMWGQGQTIDCHEILSFLKEWLLDHILVEDQRIGTFVDARKTAAAP